MYDIIVYYNKPYKIGGIETFIYQLGKIYKDKDLTFMYKESDVNQLERFKKVYKRVVQYKGEPIKCNKLIINDVSDIWILPFVEANEYIRIIHNDYVTANINQPIPQNLKRIIDHNTIHPFNFKKPIKYYGVSKRACVAFERMTGEKAKLCYNPLELDRQPRKVLHLISTTRLSPEKGGARMIKLAEMLEEHNIPYIWTVFGDEKVDFGKHNFVVLKPRLDVIDYIADADYLVQLSDYEGMPYVLFEALTVGTPVIATEFYAAKELHIDDGLGFILNFDMTDVPIEEIYNKTFDFKWQVPSNIWDKILS